MHICDYGCNQEATQQFKNGKWCCTNLWIRCPAQRKRFSGKDNPFFGKKHTEENKKKVGDINRGRTAWNKGRHLTKEEKELISILTKKGMDNPEVRAKMKANTPIHKMENHHHWGGGYYNNGIALYDTYIDRLSYMEKCRRNKDDRKVLEVICTYCGIWFVPTPTQVYERARAAEGRNYGELRLYCSKQCKEECPIFHQISYEKGHKPETSREVQSELRQMRFEIDNYTCLACNRTQEELKKLDIPLNCHHVEGIRWEPIESADLDKVITLCKPCHIKVHQKEGCGYNDMKCGL